jgi:hypothetical protein
VQAINRAKTQEEWFILIHFFDARGGKLPLAILIALFLLLQLQL